MDTTSLLRQIACLLECPPHNVDCQLHSALECLCAGMGAVATGIFWPDTTGRLQPHGQYPSQFTAAGDLLAEIDRFEQTRPFSWDSGRLRGLAAPMRAGGETLGRIWVLAPADKGFEAAEEQFVAIVANQLALALENARRYNEESHVAARRAELLRRVIATQDERCRRVSRELHDEISQSLAAMALDLEGLQAAGQVTDDRALERLGNLRSGVLAALDEVNRIILDLRPTLLEDLGLVPALRWYAAQRLEVAGVKVHMRAAGVNSRLAPHLETTLYRIGQEALTNVARHAHAANVWVTIRQRSGHVELSVRDDGRGFDVEQVLASPDTRVGIGLFGMKERAALAGGRCGLHSSPGCGARVIVRIPLGEAEVAYESHPRAAG